MTRAAIAAASVVLAWLALVPPAMAQIGLTQGDQPLEVDASISLEWHSDQQAYVARGDARARSGEIEVRADVLVARYREAADGETEIYRLEATGNVVISQPGERATGDGAVYDLDRALFVLTGGDLRYETATDPVTARDSLEFWQDRDLAVARGDAAIVRPDQRLSADIITAQFADDASGDTGLSVLSAVGNVRIVTPTDVATADEAVYDVASQIATLSGSVQMTQGPSQLTGDRAEFNLGTGMRRLIAEPGAGGRVQGLLVPEPAEDTAPDSPVE